MSTYSQEVEFQDRHRQNALSEQERADEEYARRLMQEEQEAYHRSQQTPSASHVPHTQSGPGQVQANPQPSQYLLSGESTAIRFCHPSTGNQLGEVMLASSLSGRRMQFEVRDQRGRFLTINNDGGVEFSVPVRNNATFVSQVHPDGCISLLNEAHQGKTNILGGQGWYLALSAEGRLMGNAGDNALSRWRLIAVPAATATATATASAVGGTPVGRAPAPTSVVGDPGPVQGSVVGTTVRASVGGSVSISLPGAGRNIPDVFAPVPTQLQWLGTEAGQNYLAREPQLLQMYFDESLCGAMHRPDWPVAAQRWRDYRIAENRNTPRFGNMSTSTSRPVDLLELSPGETASPASQCCFDSPSEYSFFKENGYSVLKSVIPDEVLKRAQRIVNASVVEPPERRTDAKVHSKNIRTGGGECICLKQGPLLADADVMSLYYDSGVHAAVQRLISGAPGADGRSREDKVSPLLAAHEIHVRPPQLVHLLSDMYNPAPDDNSLPLSARDFITRSGTRWKVDGFTRDGGHSPFTMLVMVCLSDCEGDTEDSDGQIAVFAGSHVTVNNKARHMLLNGSFNDLAQLSDENATQKPDLIAEGSRETKLRLKAGDVVFMSGKLAYREEANFGVSTQSMVMFPVTHVDHSRLRVGALDRWHIEFSLLESLMPPAPAPLPPPPAYSESVQVPANVNAIPHTGVQSATQQFAEIDVPSASFVAGPTVHGEEANGLFANMAIHGDSETINPVHHQDPNISEEDQPLIPS